MNEITISCLHPTARAKKAIECFHEWRRKSKRFSLVEWIFGVDEGDTDTRNIIIDFVALMKYPNVSVAINYGHSSCVSAINRCARVAKGDILLEVCDDVGCPDEWDEIVRSVLHSPHDHDLFVKFSDGQNSELCPHPVISRKRYEILGYFFHPDFNPFHGFCDEDATLRARKDGSYIERLDVVFEHRHPAFGKNEWDEIYLKAVGETKAQETLWKHHPEKRK
jgi:glycosyltransferase involved in cell wall biosynthesis